MPRLCYAGPMTKMMSTEALTSMTHRVETALVNDAIRAHNDGTATWEQSEFLSAWEADHPVDALVDEQGGIFTEEDGRDDLPHFEESCQHGLSLWLCEHPIYHYPAHL